MSPSATARSWRSERGFREPPNSTLLDKWWRLALSISTPTTTPGVLGPGPQPVLFSWGDHGGGRQLRILHCTHSSGGVEALVRTLQHVEDMALTR